MLQLPHQHARVVHERRTGAQHVGVAGITPVVEDVGGEPVAPHPDLAKRIAPVLTLDAAERRHVHGAERLGGTHRRHDLGAVVGSPVETCLAAGATEVEVAQPDAQGIRIGTPRDRPGALRLLLSIR